MVEGFYHHIDEEDLLRAKEILSQLEQEIGRDSPLAVKARERLELEIGLSEDWNAIHREVCLEKLRELTKGKPGTWSRTVLQKMLKSYENKDKEGKYREYSGIVIWYLKKKLKS